MENIVEFAKIIRSIYEKQREELGIPFFQEFPENCCEGASFFFGHIAQDMFPNETIEIVKGYRFHDKREEYHYWIEINDVIFDLTADQFNNVDSPIFEAKTGSPHLGFTLVPKLLLGNPVSKALALRVGKLELLVLSSQAGAWGLARHCLNCFAVLVRDVEYLTERFPRRALEP